MKTARQLLRQALKTISGIILMTLAVAILCTCVGQALAVRTTTEKLNQQFSTVAIPKGEEQQYSSIARMSDELLAWLDKTAQENPDVVKQIARHGILSAYIPEMTPLNVTSQKYINENMTWEHYEYYFYQSTPRLMPYTCAMLVITLEEVSEPEPQTTSYAVDQHLSMDDFAYIEDYLQWFNNTEKETATKGYTVELTGTVTDVISLQEGYRNPVGRIARLTMTAPTLEQIRELNLVPGEQYVVYGVDYVDEYWKLIGELNWDGRYDYTSFEPFDPSWFYRASEETREWYMEHYEATGNTFWLNLYGSLKGIALTERECDMVNAISMTLALPIQLTEYEEIRENGDGKLLELRPITDVTYTDGTGKTVTVSNEEYSERYQIPTITRLDGSVEDFLKAAEGTPWQGALERDAINNQSFAVIGVDNLNYLADFSLEKTKIVEGRNFTADELGNGARVCIIHEELALANGLEVGDTLTASFYGTDFGLPYQDSGILNPTASFYFETTPFAETEVYTIVGICRGERTFPDVAQNEYAFSANTVYVPRSSVQTEMETRNSIPFVTPVLHNGKIEAFHKLAMQSGYAGLFKYYDQGYSVIASNFHNYEALARQVLTVGAAIYAVLLLLFLLLYPGAQKKAVRTMESLGVPYIRRFGHVLASSVAIILPAAVLGGILGTLLWDRVAEVLQASAESAVTLEIQPGALATVAAVQLLLALLLNALVAIPVAAHKKLSDRR